MNWYFKCLQHYVDFSGRARRKEFWMFYLFNIVFVAVAGFIDGILGIRLLAFLYPLFIFLPGLAVTVRRLHDIGKSGWMCLINLIPIIGTIWLLILLCTDSQYGSNKWGDNPKGV